MGTELLLTGTSRLGGQPKSRAVTVDADLRPWARQPKESEPNFAAFCLYRNMHAGRRTLAAVAEIVGRSESAIRNISARHGWPARCAEYDRHTQSEHADYMQERARKLTERQIDQGEELEAALLGQARPRVDELSAKDAAVLLVAVRKDNRSVVGLDARVDGTTTVNVSTAVQVNGGPLSAEVQLARIREALEAYPDLRDVIQGVLAE